MSGGSFDYLYIKETHQVVEMRDDVERMQKELERLNHWDAARRTADVLQYIQAIRNVQEDIADVWQAVEWCCSSDWGPDQVETAVEKWRKKIRGETDTK